MVEEEEWETETVGVLHPTSLKRLPLKLELAASGRPVVLGLRSHYGSQVWHRPLEPGIGFSPS